MFCKLDSPFATEALPFFSGQGWQSHLGFLSKGLGRCSSVCKIYWLFTGALHPGEGISIFWMSQNLSMKERAGWQRRKSAAGACVQLSWRWEVSLGLVSLLREPWAVTICIKRGNQESWILPWYSDASAHSQTMGAVRAQQRRGLQEIWAGEWPSTSKLLQFYVKVPNPRVDMGSQKSSVSKGASQKNLILRQH